MTSRRSFLRRLVGIAAAATVAPRVVEAVVEALPAAPPAGNGTYSLIIGRDALNALEDGVMFRRIEQPAEAVTFASIKRISDQMRRDFGVERF